MSKVIELLKSHEFIGGGVIGASMGVFGTESLDAYMVFAAVLVAGLIKLYFREKRKG